MLSFFLKLAMLLSDRDYQQLDTTTEFLFAAIEEETISVLFEAEYNQQPGNQTILKRSCSYDDALAKAASLNQYFQQIGSLQTVSPKQVMDTWERERSSIEFSRANIERICRIALDKIDFQLESKTDWAIAWLIVTRIKPQHKLKDLPVLLSQMLLDANHKRAETRQQKDRKPHIVWRSRFAKLKEARQVFGLSDSASLDELRSRYRHLCKQHHPDNGGEMEDFLRLQESYDLLMTSAA
ncbi:MAG: J domain-containing protein [Cyanobacteria bacterium P01_A01_bin.3]